VLQSADGSRFEGEFREGRRNGEGVLRQGDGTVYKGLFEEDRLVERR